VLRTAVHVKFLLIQNVKNDNIQCTILYPFKLSFYSFLILRGRHLGVSDSSKTNIRQGSLDDHETACVLIQIRVFTPLLVLCNSNASGFED